MNVHGSLIAGLWATAALSLALAAPAQSADLEAGRKVFEEVCAACHGAIGRPDPSNPVVQALDGFTVYFVVLAAALTAVCVLAALAYLDLTEIVGGDSYPLLLFLFVGIVVFMSLAGRR